MFVEEVEPGVYQHQNSGGQSKENVPFVLSKKFEVPAAINSHLEMFQRKNIQFLFEAYLNGSGAILADSPKSGKKVTVSAFISALFSCEAETNAESSKPAPALVIVPREKISSWRKIFSTWTLLKCESCLDLNLSELPASINVILYPFDLLSKSVVNVAKRKWKVLFIDNIDIITEKPKFEVMLHQLPLIYRFGISSCNFKSGSAVIPILSWVHPEYHEKYKKERDEISLFITHFEKKSGSSTDQIQGLFLKAELLDFKTRLFSTYNFGPFEFKTHPKEHVLLQDVDHSHASGEYGLNETVAKVKVKKKSSKLELEPTQKLIQSSKTPKPKQPKVEIQGFKTQVQSDDSRPEAIKRLANQMHHKKIPAESSSTKPVRNVKNRSETVTASENSSVDPNNSVSNTVMNSTSSNAISENLSQYEELESLIAPPCKVPKPPPKRHKSVAKLSSTPSTSVSVETSQSHSASLSGTSQTTDLNSSQFSMIESLFLTSPNIRKPAPKLKNFTQTCSQKTVLNPSEEIPPSSSKAVNSSDLDAVLFSDEKPRKPAPKLFCKQKTPSKSTEMTHAELLDDVFFSRPVSKKIPPKRKFSDKKDIKSVGSSEVLRRPMQVTQLSDPRQET